MTLETKSRIVRLSKHLKSREAAERDWEKARADRLQAKVERLEAAVKYASIIIENYPTQFPDYERSEHGRDIFKLYSQLKAALGKEG